MADPCIYPEVDLLRASEHDVIEKLRSIDEIELRDPYRSRASTQRYSERVRASLLGIPAKFHDIAIILFADVLYIPARVLRATWQHVWCDLRESSQGELEINSFHIFTQDEEPISTEFIRENKIQGRLDSDKTSRISSITELASIILQSRNQPNTLDPAKENDLKLVLQKPLWILLNDKVISGHSAGSELERICSIANRLPNPPKVILAAQFITEMAILDLCRFIPRENIYFGILLPEHMRVNSETSPLWQSFRPDIQSLTLWFSESLIKPNLDIYGRMLEIDANGMQYGYKATGLLYSDEINCPTGTLPLFWHKCSKYVGPFPRIHSRVGKTSNGARKSKQIWNEISELESIPIDVEVR